jgi:hypothetical protein
LFLKIGKKIFVNIQASFSKFISFQRKTFSIFTHGYSLVE